MVSPFTDFDQNSNSHNNEQNSVQSLPEIPDCALLLDILKTMESQFQKRGFLPHSNKGAIQPLWFIAEHERNLYLWRNGYSLNELDQFEFWVDIEYLAQKRIYYLEMLKEGFSFSNPLWGLTLPSHESILAELKYLGTFLKATKKIEKHVWALSRAGMLLREELHPSEQTRKTVLLPIVTDYQPK